MYSKDGLIIEGNIVNDNGNSRPKVDPYKFEKLAKAYVEHVGSQGRYPLYFQRKFYLYDGTKYVQADDVAMSIRGFFKATKKAQSNNVVGNVIPIIQAYCYRDSARYQSMPFYTGKDEWPIANNIIAYQNGLLDLSRYLAGGRDLIPHTPAWCSTFCLPHNFNADATCPLWLKFLGEVYEDDSDRIAMLQEWFGYTLSSDTSLQKALIMNGKIRSGKGTIHHVWQQMLGNCNWTAYSLTQITSDFGLSPLVNRQAAFVGEVELSGNPQKAVIVERLKGIIGEDSQSVNVKHEPLTTQKLPTRFIISCNEVPHLFDPSGALGARLLFLQHRISFLGREDSALRDRLAGEIEGINNWALEGLARLRNNGGRFTEPETSRTIREAFDRSSSPVKAFVKDCLCIELTIDPGDLIGATFVAGPLTTTKKAVWDLYEEWCKENDNQPKPVSYFYQDLKNTLPQLQEQKLWNGGQRVRCYKGVGPKPVQNATQDGPGPSEPSPIAPGAAQ